ncbi:translation initiation factor IF-3 [Marinobacterium arenosum]|uniref:translation initiation factor IF-3 n=1 Tax=Marinobacterium arenosum TaxID=2862496 RepID=UPI001C937785|nr:translation initiation factor IF-3 [Marinobacterium arenosum]MBY4675771.1 translation initiation factor IF-3 [Marinobacterium arenosum]
MRRDNRRGARREQRPPINENIRARECRLIGPDGTQIGVVSIKEALEAAQEVELDLVQISDADPIVCKVMDYGKHLYEQKKQANEAKKKQHQTQVKEVKFRPNTDIGDYQVKLRNLVRFLEDGDKVKVTLRYRGREMAHQELGMQLMQRVEKDLIELGTVEQRPKMEGRQLIMVIAPKKKK